MDNIIRKYIDYISRNKTERECVESTIKMAEEMGYKNIEETESLKVGDKVYCNVYKKALILFNIGSEEIENGMNILGAHIDSPRIDLKMKPLYEKGGIVYLNTHYYGGIKKYQWVTHPLSLRGHVIKKNGEDVSVLLGEEDDDFTFTISDILPHIAQEQMKKSAAEFIPGESLDLVVALGSESEKDNGRKEVLSILKDKYGIEEDDFLSAELEVVPAGRAKYLGLKKDMILGYGQDDRVCAFTSVAAMLEEKDVRRTSCTILADKEEIGSDGATGMHSLMLENALYEVLVRMGKDSAITARRALKNSVMLSSDVNSAYDPLNAELYDEDNASRLGGGIVFNKYTGSRGKNGASDANAELIARLRNTLDEKKIKYQMADMAKVDVGGGGTIAKFMAYYGMQVIDAGVSVLSMHAPFEITSTFDVECAYNAYRAFLNM